MKIINSAEGCFLTFKEPIHDTCIAVGHLGSASYMLSSLPGSRANGQRYPHHARAADATHLLRLGHRQPQDKHSLLASNHPASGQRATALFRACTHLGHLTGFGDPHPFWLEEPVALHCKQPNPQKQPHKKLAICSTTWDSVAFKGWQVWSAPAESYKELPLQGGVHQGIRTRTSQLSRDMAAAEGR